MTHNEAIKDFQTFADEVIIRLAPGDATDILPGMRTFTESYRLLKLSNAEKMKMEFAVYVEGMINKIDPEVDRKAVEDELFRIATAAWKKYSDLY